MFSILGFIFVLDCQSTLSGDTLSLSSHVPAASQFLLVWTVPYFLLRFVYKQNKKQKQKISINYDAWSGHAFADVPLCHPSVPLPAPCVRPSPGPATGDDSAEKRVMRQRSAKRRL